MSTWVLIFYMSTGIGNGSTGGPAVIDGFTSKQKCEVAIKAIKDTPKFDWAECKEVNK